MMSNAHMYMFQWGYERSEVQIKGVDCSSVVVSMVCDCISTARIEYVVV